MINNTWRCVSFSTSSFQKLALGSVFINVKLICPYTTSHPVYRFQLWRHNSHKKSDLRSHCGVKISILSFLYWFTGCLETCKLLFEFVFLIRQVAGWIKGQLHCDLVMFCKNTFWTIFQVLSYKATGWRRTFNSKVVNLFIFLIFFYLAEINLFVCFVFLPTK